MHNKDKYPEIWAAMMAARDKKAKLMAKREVFTNQIKEVQVELEATIAKKEALNIKAMADYDEIAELSREIGNFATAMGAETLSKES